MGESFSAVSPLALSLVTCCKVIPALLGTDKPNLQFVPMDQMNNYISGKASSITFDHVRHSPNCSIAKGQRLLGYAPRYTTEQIYAECLEYLIESRQLSI